MINEWSGHNPVGGGVLQISSESQVFWDLKYSIPALLGVEKFGKYFLASLN